MSKFSLRAICHCAILVALEVVLNRFCSIQTPFLKIGFSFVAVVMGAILYGPIGGAVVGGLGDLIGAILFPFGPYHPGFSICGALMGAIYGFFLWQESKRFDNSNRARFWPNIVLPVVINAVIIALFLNTLWISQLYSSKTYWGYFVGRIPQELGLGVVKLIIIPVLYPIAKQLRKSGLVANRKVDRKGSKDAPQA
ncbi:MAG: folate family ECF transporter S component [Oscillospiraceae bacterium]|nr:folate family ECF transporter S component [Oscillospiraceae bacterium]